MKMVSFMLPSLSNAHHPCALIQMPVPCGDLTITPGRYHMYLTERLRDKIPAVFPNIVLFSISNLIKCCFQFLHTSYPDAFKTAILSIDSVQPFHACTSGRFPACKVRCMVIDRMSIFPSFRCSMVSTNSALFFP